MKTFCTISAGFLCFLLTVPGLQAQEDAKATTEKKTASDKSEASVEKEKQKSPRELIAALIKDGKLQEASKDLDEALAEAGGDRLLRNLRSTLALAFARKRNYKETATQYAKLLDNRLDDPKARPGELASLLASARVYFPRGGRVNEVLPSIEKVEQRISKRITFDKATSEVRYLLAVRNMKAFALQKDDRQQADKLWRDDFQAMQELHTRTNDKVSAELFALTMRNLFQSLPTGDERNELFAHHQDLARAQIDDGNTQMLGSYVSAGLSQLSRLYRSEPAEAKELMISLNEMLTEFEDDEKLKRSVASYKSLIRRYESRIESALKIAAMYDKPAPEIDENAAWVGVEQPLDLKGKVVLLDFWAIWCGPCLATFPHLQHLDEEYGDQGLQVVGVTRYYNYSWDEETKRTKRGARDAEPDTDAEHEALQKFLASHNLSHPTVVVPKDSTMHKQFNVSGIPHAALIDKKGILRLVKVGSGSASAEELEAKIKELLSEG